MGKTPLYLQAILNLEEAVFAWLQTVDEGKENENVGLLGEVLRKSVVVVDLLDVLPELQ